MKNIFLEDLFKIEQRTKFRDAFSNQRCHSNSLLLDQIDAVRYQRVQTRTKTLIRSCFILMDPTRKHSAQYRACDMPKRSEQKKRFIINNRLAWVWWVSMGFDGFRWVAMGCDGLRWVLMTFLMGSDDLFDGFWWVLMGFDGFWWVLMGFGGF